VELTDNTTYLILGIGSTSFQLDSGNVLSVDEILSVPRLTKNLLYFLVLEDKGFRVIFMENKALLWPKHEDLNSASVIGVREGGLYKVPVKLIQAMIHDMVSPCELWHTILGHLHFKVLPGLQNMVKGMPMFKSDFDSVCRGCALSKNIKKSFPSSTKRSKGILESIHYDLCGPMYAPSLSGYLYYVLFIDEFSCKSWVYFLKAKSENFNKFQEFKALVENQTRKHTRALKYDNGGEFESHDFNEFCRDVTIKRQLTIPYNP
jgi:hypothetical protein